MIKIMFVCHGNICRSPMAEFILKDMVKKCGRADDFVIASSATSTEEIWNGIGNLVYPPAKAEFQSTACHVMAREQYNYVKVIMKNMTCFCAWTITMSEMLFIFLAATEIIRLRS